MSWTVCGRTQPKSATSSSIYGRCCSTPRPRSATITLPLSLTIWRAAHLTQAMLADRTATLSAAVLSMATVSLHIKNGQKKTRGFYSSGSFALHSPFTVASITDSSLSSKLSSCASKRLRTELFLTSLLGNIYSSTETSNIVIS